MRERQNGLRVALGGAKERLQIAVVTVCSQDE